MKLSIIIPTFNRRDIIRPLLESLLSDTESLAAMEQEIIVVDDRGTDGTSAMIEKEFPSVRLILGPGKNAEFAKRAAIEISTGDFIVNLDDDCIPQHGWIARVLPALERGEKLVQVKTVFIDMGQEQIENEDDKRYFHTGFRYDGMPVATLNGGYRPQYIENCHEFGCFYSRDVLREIPLDDPNLRYHHLGESASFYLRAAKQGYRVWFEPTAIIDHLGALAGGCKDRSQKQSPKKNCTEFTTGMVHNFVVLARMRSAWRALPLIPIFLGGGLWLSLVQRKNCFKYFLKGLYQGLTRKFVPAVPYSNL